ncbi:Oidioi.mRNA.OKI2018_I69.chr1.g2380.t1.cds [Oikopleura dioica]|uniref:Oidioi.mRNA.OKI2018_I69.chr1.g2380.t1.cds n=1 Tax=Oikopleura dioica TaxID=34765 RepID=A0ABN7SV65_OIKDI|nr:Oidioi.mRNA.OKI2018_I69.chr1.g2380.t1.cds [Oikopleura dioica]
MSATKLVLKSTTSTSLNDRFSKIMRSRPTEEPTRQLSGGRTGAGIAPGSERNRRFAEELERRSAPARRPVVNRIGDVGQGGARGFSASLRQSGINKRSAMAGRVGKRNSSGGAGNLSARQSANRALAKATSMLRDTERELSQLKHTQAARGRGGKRGGATRGGATRGGRGGARGGGRGGKTTRKPVSAEDLDAEMDSYMLKTKGGLDSQLDEYMSKTKKGLDAQMDEYMNQKSS